MLKAFARIRACYLVIIIALAIATATVAQEVDDTAATNSEAEHDELRTVAEIRDVSEFVNNVLKVHPRLTAAAAERDEAGALERAAERPIYNPEFGADYEDAVDKTYQMGIAQTVDWAGKRDAAYAKSSSQRRAADAGYERTRNQITAEILSSLSEYWVSLALLQLGEASKSLMHDFAQQAGMRYKAGDMARVEYETAQLAYAEVLMKTAELSADTAAVANRLMAYGATPNPNTWPQMPTTLPNHTVNPRDINRMLDVLPQVVTARELANAAASEVELAKSMKKPDPTFGVRVGEEDSETLVGVSFSIPLYVRNNFNENVMAAISAKTRADAEANAVERVTKARLMVAMERFSTMRSAWTDWEKIGPVSVGVQTNLLTRLWEAREISMSDFLLQYRQTLVAQKTAAELRQTLWNAWIDYLEETNQVESWLSDAAFVDGSVAGERK